MHDYRNVHQGEVFSRFDLGPPSTISGFRFGFSGISELFGFHYALGEDMGGWNSCFSTKWHQNCRKGTSICHERSHKFQANWTMESNSAPPLTSCPMPSYLQSCELGGKSCQPPQRKKERRTQLDLQLYQALCLACDSWELPFLGQMRLGSCLPWSRREKCHWLGKLKDLRKISHLSLVTVSTKHKNYMDFLGIFFIMPKNPEVVWLFQKITVMIQHSDFLYIFDWGIPECTPLISSLKPQEFTKCGMPWKPAENWNYPGRLASWIRMNTQLKGGGGGASETTRITDIFGW